MSQKNDTLPLILALLITLGLFGGGLWLLRDRLPGGSTSRPTQTDAAQTGDDAPVDDAAILAQQSLGEKILVPPGAAVNPQAQAQKQAGVEALAAKNYAEAVAALQASLQIKPNDPEALIYLNNARIGDKPAHTIAIVVPLVGDVDASQEMLRGVAQAQEDGNYAGSQRAQLPIKVRIVSDGSSPSQAAAVANSLVANTEVLGVVGHYSSDSSLIAGAVYNQKELVMISPVSTSVKLSNLGRYTFRTVPSDFVAAGALANYMLKQQQQKAALYFNSQSEYSKSIKSEFDRALSLSGGQVVSEFDFADPAFSAATSFNQATQQGATVLALMPNSGQLDRALQVAQVNQKQLKLLAGDDVYAPKTLAVGNIAVEGMVVAVPWHVLKNPQSEFVARSRQIWRADVNWRTAMSYDAAEALIAALALQQNPTRQGVQQALADANFSTEGATGTVRFLPSGDRNQSVQLVEVKPGSRSGYRYDFVPIQ